MLQCAVRAGHMTLLFHRSNNGSIVKYDHRLYHGSPAGKLLICPSVINLMMVVLYKGQQPERTPGNQIKGLESGQFMKALICRYI